VVPSSSADKNNICYALLRALHEWWRQETRMS
jgi:hypothetical protein